ncbi:MAG: hypothetical protein ACO2YY_09140 [Pseudohongiellaceae bacterium]
MAKEKKMQVVEDDEIENVGIMSGFMDDIDGILSEIMEEEQEATSGEDDDMARVMGRTPDSPEILMNNLRGNMRSLDARREELAEMVGFSAAEETPDEVLAMLQPVLAEQEMAGIAGFSPLNSGSPQAPPESLTPPADAGGVLSLPMGQESMPAPMPPAPAPMPMKNGGMVQHFQEGSSAEGVSPADDYYQFPAEVVARAMQLMGQEREDLPNAIQIAEQLSPEYQAFLGQSPEQAKAQLLMSLGQAAFNYGANVDAQGNPLRGSAAARLAGALAPVPSMIGKTAADLQKQEQAARALALQSGQSQVAAAQERNKLLMQEQSDLARDILKEQYKTTKPSAIEQRIQLLMSQGLTRDAAVQEALSTSLIDPTTGNVMTRNPVTGVSEVADMVFPEPPATGEVPEEGFGLTTQALRFDPGKGTGFATAVISTYNSLLGQVPFLPIALDRAEAVNSLANIQSDIIRAYSSSSRPPVVEQERLLAMVPSPNDMFKAPREANAQLLQLVDGLGEVYLDAKKYSEDPSVSKALKGEAEEQVRLIERAMRKIVRKDVIDPILNGLDGIGQRTYEFGAMSLQELADIDPQTLSGADRAIYAQILGTKIEEASK